MLTFEATATMFGFFGVAVWALLATLVWSLRRYKKLETEHDAILKERDALRDSKEGLYTIISANERELQNLRGESFQREFSRQLERGVLNSARSLQILDYADLLAPRLKPAPKISMALDEPQTPAPTTTLWEHLKE